jgi:hypothetical protein
MAVVMLMMMMCTNDVRTGIRLESFNKESKFAYVAVAVVRTDLALPGGYTYIEQRYCNVIRVASVEDSFSSV